jgi:RNA polymerase sigma factor (sigma-70 family)
MSRADAELVRCARAGDRKAFAALLARHLPLMERVCRRVLRSADGLEDVSQEAALQALLSIDALREPSQFGPWLAGIGLNVARRTLRRESQPCWSLDALSGGQLVNAEPIDDRLGPEELAEATELSARVRAAVADLPHGQRAAILLVYLSGLTYRETAMALGIEVGTVKTRLHKGRHNLQQRLRDLWMETTMTTDVQQQMVQMRVADVRRVLREGADTPRRSVVILEEVGGTRRVPIWIGNFEGDHIAMLVGKLNAPRPLTFAFTAGLLKAGGIRVREAQVHRLADETFYAQVVIEGANGAKTVDSRPSDAIALALAVGAPISAAMDVIEACEAVRTTQQAEGKPDLTSIGVGAIEIIDNLIENWPGQSKPTRGPASEHP